MVNSSAFEVATMATANHSTNVLWFFLVLVKHYLSLFVGNFFEGKNQLGVA